MPWGQTRHEPGRHLAAGVPSDFVGVLTRVPSLAAARELAVVALRVAILATLIDEEVQDTRWPAPWLVAALAFDLAIFLLACASMRNDRMWNPRSRLRTQRLLPCLSGRRRAERAMRQDHSANKRANPLVKRDDAVALSCGFVDSSALQARGSVVGAVLQTYQ